MASAAAVAGRGDRGQRCGTGGMDGLIGLFVLLFVLLFITLIGHGIWSLVARLFGYRIRYVRKGETAPAAAAPTTEAAQAQFERRVARLRLYGLIREETYADLMRAMRGGTVGPPVSGAEPPLAARAEPDLALETASPLPSVQPSAAPPV